MDLGVAGVSAAVKQDEPGTGGPDLRLAFVSVGVWLAAVAVLYLGAGWGIGLSIVACGGIWFSRRGDRSWMRVVGAVAIGVAAGALVASAQVAVRDAQPFREWVDEERVATLRVTVADDPLRLRGGQGEKYRVALRVERARVGDEEVRVSVRAVAFARNAGRWRWDKVLPGQALTIKGRLSPGEPGTLSAADVVVAQAPRLRGDPPWWQRAAGFLRAGLRQACADLPDEPGGLLPGLALGDVSTLDEAVDADFRDAGMTHLLAVSGANVAIVVGAAVLVAGGCGAGRRTRVVVGIAVIVGFVVLVRPSPSVLRAAVMGGLGLLVLSRRGGRDAVPVLAAAVAILLLIDPGLAANLGFVLSVVATAGLVFFASRWTGSLRRRGWPEWLAVAVAVPAAAQLAVTPVLAAAAGTITPVAVVANALAAMAVPPATVLAVAATLLWPLWPDLAVALTWLASWPAQWLVAVAGHAAGVPSGSVPWPSGVLPGLLLAVLIVVALLLLRWRPARRFLLVVALGIVVGVVPIRLLSGGWPPSGWVMVVCDVGQGDAILLPTGDDSRVVVVDAGPDPRAIDSCLRSLGVERVALLAFSHAHADHIGGVTGVYSGRTVEAVLRPMPDEHDQPGAEGPSGVGPPPGNDRQAALTPSVGPDGKRGNLRAQEPSGPAERDNHPVGPVESDVELGQRGLGVGPGTGGPNPRPGPAGADGPQGRGGGDGRGKTAGNVGLDGRAEPGGPAGSGGRAGPGAGQLLTEATRDTLSVTTRVGDSIDTGRTRLEVLAPDTTFTGTRSDPNNNSFVLRATVAGVSILLSGDVEEPAQRSVLASGQRLAADVLKVPHHGSAYFDAGFFEAVNPRLAVVSVGRGNEYGHPHPKALRQLRGQGAAVHRTDRHGTFAVVAGGGGLEVVTME